MPCRDHRTKLARASFFRSVACRAYFSTPSGPLLGGGLAPLPAGTLESRMPEWRIGREDPSHPRLIAGGAHERSEVGGIERAGERKVFRTSASRLAAKLWADGGVEVKRICYL